MKTQEIPYHIFVGTFMGLASSYTDLLPHSREADAFRTRICNRLVEIAAECSAVIEADKTSPAVVSSHETGKLGLGATLSGAAQPQDAIGRETKEAQ